MGRINDEFMLLAKTTTATIRGLGRLSTTRAVRSLTDKKDRRWLKFRLCTKLNRKCGAVGNQTGVSVGNIAEGLGDGWWVAVYGEMRKNVQICFGMGSSIAT